MKNRMATAKWRAGSTALELRWRNYWSALVRSGGKEMTHREMESLMTGATAKMMTPTNLCDSEVSFDCRWEGKDLVLTFHVERPEA